MFRFAAVCLTVRAHQVDLVKRENERLNRQIEILANRFSAKLTCDVLVREGWLDKRSERLHESNVRRASTLSLQSANVTCADFEKGCIGLEDVAAAVGGGTFAPKISRILTVFRWFQLFTDRLVRWPHLQHALSHVPLIFAQAYYESNLDAFPGSRKERKCVALKRLTGTSPLFYLSGTVQCM